MTVVSNRTSENMQQIAKIFHYECPNNQNKTNKTKNTHKYTANKHKMFLLRLIANGIGTFIMRGCDKLIVGKYIERNWATMDWT